MVLFPVFSRHLVATSRSKRGNGASTVDETQREDNPSRHACTNRYDQSQHRSRRSRPDPRQDQQRRIQRPNRGRKASARRDERASKPPLTGPFSHCFRLSLPTVFLQILRPNLSPIFNIDPLMTRFF